MLACRGGFARVEERLANNGDGRLDLVVACLELISNTPYDAS
jgi:hypothetical protein